MFATLLGALPRPTGVTTIDDAVLAVIRAQEEAGLEPVTDGRLRDPGWFDGLIDGLLDWAPVDGVKPGDLAASWSVVAGMTDRAVKQALPGPYSIGWHAIPNGVWSSRQEAVRRAATGLRGIVRALVAAGCPLVEIEETEAHRIGTDEVERALFREAHERLIGGIDDTHLNLSIASGAADTAGIETILAAPYASLALDLIAGPDNWNLATRAPRDRGIIVGALSARAPKEPKEILLWGAHYAASTQGRGIDRVGIGSAGSWADLEWTDAERRLRALGEAARLAAMPPSEELRRQLDPKAVSARRAGLGHGAPPAPSKRRGR